MIYMFLADGFEETEAVVTADILRRAELSVVLAGVSGNIVTGAHGMSILADDTADNLTDDEGCDAVILPGGMPGTLNLDKSAAVHSFLDKTHAAGGLIAAICAAPSILGRKGMLRGVSATCFPGFEDQLDGAVLSSAPVVECGNFITAKGPGVTTDFALKIVERLCGRESSDSIRKAMQCLG